MPFKLKPHTHQHKTSSESTTQTDPISTNTHTLLLTPTSTNPPTAISHRPTIIMRCVVLILGVVALGVATSAAPVTMQQPRQQPADHAEDTSRPLTRNGDTVAAAPVPQNFPQDRLRRGFFDDIAGIFVDIGKEIGKDLKDTADETGLSDFINDEVVAAFENEYDAWKNDPLQRLSEVGEQWADKIVNSASGCYEGLSGSDDCSAADTALKCANTAFNLKPPFLGTDAAAARWVFMQAAKTIASQYALKCSSSQCGKQTSFCEERQRALELDLERAVIENNCGICSSDDCPSFCSRAGLIKAVHGICLDSPQRSTKGGQVHMWTCNNGNKNQQWRYDAATGQIRNAHGICLDASQRSTRGGKVHMWSCNTSNKNQQWQYDASNGQIKSRHGICLDASQRSTKRGKVHMWTCNTANKNQQWQIV